MIPIEQCKQGYLYKIHARNFGLGVYSEVDRGFIGIRYKFGDRFLDIEYHYDTGVPHGTASPIEEICKVPDGIEIVEHMQHPNGHLWLDGRAVARTDLMFETQIPHGRRQGFEDRFVDTWERLPDDRYPRLVQNKQLFEWLKEYETTLAKTKKM